MNEEITALLKEVMRQHADPEAPEYNECDTAQCNWCERAAKVLEALAAPANKCVWTGREWQCGCDCLPCQSCDHK